MEEFVKARPLNSLNELHALYGNGLKRGQLRPNDVRVVMQSIRIPRRPSLDIQSRNRVLVCHDMQGGYGEDANCQGEFPAASGARRYTFDYWHHVDVFIYFSHARIAIPPPHWIAAACRNGTKILGTFITEWDEGILENERLLQGPLTGLGASRSNYLDYADALVRVMLEVGFDGWFFNIESPLAPEKVPRLLEFLAYLRQRLHQAKSGALLIWYDSVIEDGRIWWQNELNDLNYRWFETTDAFFTNYTWAEHQPQASASYASMYGRQNDVFVGIDVWGRNTFGGGGFDAYKALKVIDRANTGIAIFAPAWTYEHFGAEKFISADCQLWCDTYTGISRWMVEKRIAGNSFYTDFNRGFGSRFYWNGQQIFGRPWYYIGCQSLAPSWRRRKEWYSVKDNYIESIYESIGYSWSHDQEVAFHGGTSVKLECQASGQYLLNKKYHSPLFFTSLKVKTLLAVVVAQIYETDMESGLYIRTTAGWFYIQFQSSKDWKKNELTVPCGDGGATVEEIGLYILHHEPLLLDKTIFRIGCITCCDSDIMNRPIQAKFVDFSVKWDTKAEVYLVEWNCQVSDQLDNTSFPSLDSPSIYIDQFHVEVNSKWVGVVLTQRYVSSDLKKGDTMKITAIDNYGRSLISHQEIVQ